MRFAILGPIDVRQAGIPVPVPGTKLRLLLGCLLLHPNRVVDADRLIDLLWGEDPPSTAENVLQAHVLRLRRVLEAAEGSGTRLETVDGGYRLRIEPGELDVEDFERLVGEAAGLRKADPYAAASRYADALALWRGAVLEDLPVPDALAGRTARLDEAHLRAMEQRLEIEIDAGRAAAAVQELAELVPEHRLRERLLELQMLGLYRLGRQADALAAYREGRRFLRDELGIEPGADLQRLQIAILQQDPGLQLATAINIDLAPTASDGPASAGLDRLPVALTTFVGRTAELATLGDLLADSRLVTVVAPSGMGKTRLVVELARVNAERWPDGVAFADLTPIDRERVVDAIAQALGVREQPGRPIFESITAFLRSRRQLLVLDNCDHVVAAVARVCAALLRDSEGLVVLASSTEPLAIAGETIWALGPLAMAGATEQDPARLRAADAIQLFLGRARRARPEREVSDAELPVVLAITRRLDGLPLAIEMAAARLRALSPREILANLDDRFGLLESRDRGALPRHRTLRATLDWTYGLLDAAEQAVLRRLGTFAGPVDLSAIEAVCSDDALPRPAVFDVLAGLVDRALVAVEAQGTGVTRYRLLETVHEYARIRLRETGEEEAVQGRHLDWAGGVAEAAYDRRVGHEAEMLAILEPLIDELRLAQTRAHAKGPGVDLRMAGLLGWFWVASGRLTEGVRRTSEALTGTDAVGREAHPLDHTRALTALGNLEVFVGAPTAIENLESAVAAWRELGDTAEQGLALDGLGWAHFWSGNNDAALTAFHDGLDIIRDQGVAEIELRLVAGECQVLVANADVAARPLAEWLVRTAPVTDVRSAHFGHHFLADCALMEADGPVAAAEYAQALVLAMEMADRVETGVEIQGVAMAQACLGRTREALLLTGAAEASFAALDVQVEVPFWLALLDRWIGPARESAGNLAASILDEGRALSLETAAALALSLPRSSDESAPPTA